MYFDQFHQTAGSKNVHELHGDIRTLRCIVCEKTYPSEKYLEENGQLCDCGGFLRPNVVLFGEMLPSNAVEGAEEGVVGANGSSNDQRVAFANL